MIVGKLYMLVKSFIHERRRKKDDEIRLFCRSVYQLPHTQRYVREYFYELLGGINGSTCLLVLGFCSFFDHYIQLLHEYGKFKISLAIIKIRMLSCKNVQLSP